MIARVINFFLFQISTYSPLCFGTMATAAPRAPKRRGPSPPEEETGGGGSKEPVAPRMKEKRSRRRRHVFTPNEDNLRLIIPAPQSLKAAVNSWGALMTKVELGVVASSTRPDIGVLEMNMAFGPCIVRSHVEVTIDHMGENRRGKTVTLITKQCEEVLKQIVHKGALKMVYDTKLERCGYEFSSMGTYSHIDFFLNDQLATGSQTVTQTRDAPATVHHAVTVNIAEFKSFISYLNAGRGDDALLFIRVETVEDHVFLSIMASDDAATGTNGELMLYGTKSTPSSAASSSGSSGSASAASSVQVTPVIRSTHILDIDESRLEQSVNVGSRDNVSSVELEDALALLDESDDVVDVQYEYMAKFINLFISGLEPNSKLTLALVEVASSGSACLFLRSTTPKSVTELMLAPRAEE